MKKDDKKQLKQIITLGFLLVVLIQVVGMWMLAQYVAQAADVVHEDIHSLRVEFKEHKHQQAQ